MSRTKILHRALLAFQVAVGFGLFGVGCAVLTLALPVLWIGCALRRERVEWLTRGIIRAAFRAIFWMLRQLRFARLDVRVASAVQGPALLVCNHISLFDVLAVIACVPGCFTFVKASFVRIPLLRYIILSSGFLPVDPASPAQSAEAFERALALLQRGAVFVVFPEGTRSADGRLGSFHKGAFRLSRAAGVPLTPVHFSSTGPLINKRVLKRADGRPVILTMAIHRQGAHLPCRAGLEAEEPEISLPAEMSRLRQFFASQGA